MKTAHGAEGNFFAVDGGGGLPLFLEGFIFCGVAMANCDTVDGAAEVGMDGGFVFAGGVEFEAALCFGNGPSRC